MVPPLLLSQLLLVAFVVLCCLIHVWWPDDPCVTPRIPRTPDPPRRQRSTAPKPCPGFLQKPLCEACEQDADERPAASGSPPPLLLFTHGRRRTVDTRAHCCPDPDGAYYGRLGHGNLRANGHPGGHPWRQLPCVSCQGYCSATHGTIFHAKRSAPDLIVRVIACLAEG